MSLFEHPSIKGQISNKKFLDVLGGDEIEEFNGPPFS